jgi:uncharacterized protein (DUF1697 family)
MTATTYVVFLRAINVGSRNRVAMADLRRTVGGAGFADVTTYIQTGNVLVTSRPKPAEAVAEAIKDAIREELSLDIEVIVRTARELRRIVAANPFVATGADPATLYVGFLKSRPTPADGRALAAMDFGDDEVVLHAAEVYLRFSAGFGRSKLGGPVVERTLRTPLTVRNWKVVGALADLAERGKSRG